MLEKITIDQVFEWEPCDDYTEDRMAELAPEGFLTPIEVLNLPIPPEDRLWVLLRKEILGERALRLFACDCAERALPVFENGYPNDTRPREAIAVARTYAVGEATRVELETSRKAADAAAYAAAAYAAAAYADAAAYAAAAYAAAAYDVDIERKRQLNVLVYLVNNIGNE